MNKPYKILIAPLDWGMGHMARCIPIIAYCIEMGHDITIAGNDACKIFVRQYFPSIDFIFLKGYEISYSKKVFFFPLKIFVQIPKILVRMYHENQCLQQWYKIKKYDFIISDNRYGFYHAHAYNIILTHQLHISVPQSKYLSNIILFLNKKLLSRFHEVWVPDIENENDNSIAGKLSQKIDTLPCIQYIGLLSRFHKLHNEAKHFRVVILLSGPEPQRSILEENLLSYFVKVDYPVLLIRGKMNTAKNIQYPAHIHIENFLDKEALASVLMGADTIVCRSGYSTLMDLWALDKKAIVIPTPGQSEQEYLADRMHAKRWFYKASQYATNWQDILIDYEAFDFAPRPEIDLHKFKSTLDDLFNKKKATT